MPSHNRLDTLRHAANAFAQEVRAELGDRVDSIILYGSVARGDIHEDSDIDVLVIGQNVNAQKKRVSEIASAQERAAGDDEFIWLQPMTYDRDQFLDLYRIHSPYAENVVEEAIVLYDTGIFTPKGIYAMQQDSPDEYVQEMLNRADEVLIEGRTLMAIQSYRGAASRIYYAAFYAAQAALVHVSVRPSTSHGRVETQFRTQIVSTSLIGAGFDRLIGDAYKLRVKGDYGYTADVLESEADAMADDVERLIAAIRAMVAAGHPTPDVTA